ncbi:hypothetical protein [Maritimibacter sp. DP1N21-5]|uniref:hypothetical protein n=1 Tax=Maritimibacter sp. DP1N21-5 TaxID=2836867 RepID=UPI001C44200F|nr:hypothetical protein [Maritimibacter sp. DP1N21-5]MBV7410711.1 hypothetical protein [Maritimibacter sp. DP1N21-5]
MYEFAFIVTKPLQLLIAVAIIRQISAENKSCIVITDSFNGARIVVSRLGAVDWDLSSIDVRFCANREDAELLAANLGVRNIFVDSDVGIRRFRNILRTQMRSDHPEIWVYEEGLGTYRTDLYRRPKRCFFGMLGIGTRFGGCALTRGVYVLDPALYQDSFPHNKKEVHKIICMPSETIDCDFDVWCHVFSYSPITSNNGEVCSVYLSGWHIESDELTRFRTMSGDRYFKPHPHIKFAPPVRGVHMISAAAPAELVLMDLRKSYRHVNVFHHGSSCERYVSDERISFSNILDEDAVRASISVL